VPSGRGRGLNGNVRAMVFVCPMGMRNAP
jgi:hypothetical protein